MAIKLLPSTVIVVAGDPTARVSGETDETVGVGLFTEKFMLAEPPPGAGFVTTTAKAPAAAWSLALRGMVNWVELA